MGIKKLFSRPPWESKDPQERAKAVVSADTETAVEICAKLSQEDPDTAVRLQAIKRLGDPKLLVSLSHDQNKEVVKASRARLLQLAVGGEIPSPLETTVQSVLEDRESVEALAMQAKDINWRRWAHKRIDRPGLLGDVALKDSEPELRQAAVNRIEQSSTLRRVAEASRRSDKAVHKLATERLEAQLLADGDSKLVAQKAEKLCQGVEALMRSGSDDIEERLQQLEVQWSAIASHVGDALQKRFDATIKLVRQPAPEKATASNHESAASSKRPDAASSAPAPPSESGAPTGDDSQQLAEALEHLLEQGRGMLSGALRLDPRALKQFEGRWRRAVKDHAGDADARDRADTLYRALRGELEARIKENHGRALELIASIQEKLEPFKKELADGHFENGKTLYGEIMSLRDKLHGLGGRLPGEVESAWKRENAQLLELRDWQHWANNKRRKAMCEELENLDPATLHPDAVAEKVRAAQAEWRDMDQHEHLPGDKRKFAAPGHLWRRFQKAGQALYEPAKEYFSKRDELRSEKRDQFGEIASAMENYDANSQHHDWRALERLYNDGRRSIRDLNQIEPKYRGKMAKRLRAGLAILQPLLDGRYGDIEKQKEALIAEVEALADESDVAKATGAAKQAQRQWTEIGSARRHRERALWKRFRAANDRVFGKLAEERKEADAERNAKREQLQEIVREVSEYKIADDPNPADVRGDVRRFEQAFADVGVRAPDLERKLGEAVERIRINLDKRLAKMRETAEKGLWDALSLCREFESGVLERKVNGGDVSAFQKRFEALPPLPDSVLALLTSRRDEALAIQCGDAQPPEGEGLASNAADADKICIRLEFLAGVESPESSRKRRMDYQVSRLSATLGGGDKPPDPPDEARAIVMAWCELAFVDPGQANELDQRFHNALKALREHTPVDLL